jgi:DNA processing protein
MQNQKLYQIGLTMIKGIGDVLGYQLLQSLGDAESIFKEKTRILEKIPGIGHVLANEIKRPEVLERAEKELSFIEKNHINAYCRGDQDYPSRLHECADAPLLIYFKGTCDLNAQQIVSIVGTRKITDYGRRVCEELIADLADTLPDLIIVSGLAYGVDITAHRSALKHQLPTLAVLAHGLDRIYPLVHRPTAVEILEQGGLLTDFPSGTNPDKPNFVKRNRIIAGLSDATIVVESADKGGSLITADIAYSYSRDVFAIPGRTIDVHSQGCNRLIRENKAGLITCAADVISSMTNWNLPLSPKTSAPVQTKLMFSGNEENNRILSFLRENKGEMHIDLLVTKTNTPVHKLSGMLLELEMEGLIKVLPGGFYKAI